MTTSIPASSSTDSLTSTTDRIEEHVVLPASRSRVWRALTDPAELGAWFGIDLAGATIAPGADVERHFTIPGHEHMVFAVTIVDVVPEQRFSWRWHPHAMDPAVDYSAEPRTLVTFTLEDAPGGGTLVRVVESGFDAIPVARRVPAINGNTGGWRSQLQKRLPAYLAAA